MSIAEILLIAFGVSVDAAAVSVSGSLCPGKYSKRRCAFNAACFFGGFQFFMPLAGFYAAWLFADKFAAFDHFIAFFLLSFVGGKMIKESFGMDEEKKDCPLGEFFSPANLLLPAVATSLDALAIGAGLAFSSFSIWIPAAAMGIITAIVSACCVILGKKLSTTLPEGKLTFAGGCVIILIGIKILLQDLGVIPQF